MTDLTHITRDFLRDDGGSPLGPGMPSGAPLRSDGQSHYDAWLALLRRDPCSYCGAGHSGTVDHVDPRSRAVRGIGTAHSWVNTVGACERCNGAKRDSVLLAFLHRRRWNGPTVHPEHATRPAKPARAIPRIARRRPPEAGAHPRVGRARRRA